MRKSTVFVTISTALSAAAAGFASGGRSLIWRFYAIFTLIWLVLCVAAIVLIVILLTRGSGGRHVGSDEVTLLSVVAAIAGGLLVVAFVCLVLPEVPAAIILVVLGPPMLLFYVLSIFDVFLSPATERPASVARVSKDWATSDDA